MINGLFPFLLSREGVSNTYALLELLHDSLSDLPAALFLEVLTDFMAIRSNATGNDVDVMIGGVVMSID